MELEKLIEDSISEECRKRILKFHGYHNSQHIEHERNCRRIRDAPPKRIFQPSHWRLDSKFNPFYVIGRRKAIARSIARKINEGTYTPHAPHVRQVPKPNGGSRNVNIYEIPDAAISNMFYRHLLEKNRHRFSSFSYAYRPDRNVHFAIQDIWLDLSSESRAFVAEFDFSDFFGSISHEYLLAQFDCNGFSISQEERLVIQAFLQSSDRGIPQGTSISLFLANLVCWRLDQSFERNGLKFARYADDTIVWSTDYNRICEAFKLIDRFSKDAGIEMNLSPDKTQGISLLTKPGYPSELPKAKTSVEFLGYSISVDKIGIKPASATKIKKQISYLLYRNLIQPLQGNERAGLIIPSNNSDPALLTAIMQIRRYLFGGLTNQQLINYINGRSKRIYFKGMMSFYPLINDEAQLKELDGWLISTIHRAIKLRGELLRKWEFDRSHIFPFNVERDEIVERFRQIRIKRQRLLEIPSFMLIYRALTAGLQIEGIERIMNPVPRNYLYSR